MFIDVSRIHFEEKMMWVGVLRRSVFDYVLYKGKKKYEIRWKRAHQFLFEEATECTEEGGLESGLTLDEVCALFGWNVDYIRRIVASLERPDIRKLESSKFREDFKADHMEPETPEGLFWEKTQTPIPRFTKFAYSREYREEVTLRKIPLRLAVANPPLVAWSAA